MQISFLFVILEFQGPADLNDEIICLALCLQKGVHIEYSCEVSQLLTPSEFSQRSLADSSSSLQCGTDWPVYLLLSNNKCFGADLIVSATGVIPNADTIEAPQLAVAPDGGILVDRYMRTSLPGVYAAGDVCTAGWERAELWFQRRLWTQARQMGHWAATCMATHWTAQPDPLADARFDIFSHVTRFFGYRLITAPAEQTTVGGAFSHAGGNNTCRWFSWACSTARA